VDTLYYSIGFENDAHLQPIFKIKIVQTVAYIHPTERRGQVKGTVILITKNDQKP
jgi:hypothetical protein